MPHSLDKKTVLHVARLARLQLTDEQAATIGQQLTKVLSYVAQLEELDTQDVPPTAHPLPVTDVLRDDTPTPGLTPEDALANAPDQHHDYFRVPKVLDQGSK